jgi:hypothetical protein
MQAPKGGDSNGLKIFKNILTLPPAGPKKKISDF